jgi:hypothetical protein
MLKTAEDLEAGDWYHPCSWASDLPPCGWEPEWWGACYLQSCLGHKSSDKGDILSFPFYTGGEGSRSRLKEQKRQDQLSTRKKEDGEKEEKL